MLTLIRGRVWSSDRVSSLRVGSGACVKHRTNLSRLSTRPLLLSRFSLYMITDDRKTDDRRTDSTSASSSVLAVCSSSLAPTSSLASSMYYMWHCGK